MRGPKPTPIDLTDAERTALDTLVRRHSTPQQIALRNVSRRMRQSTIRNSVPDAPGRQPARMGSAAG